ncbi:MAG: hypothetical protein ACI4F4_04610 [Lachnospiraceae bacterium]
MNVRKFIVTLALVWLCVLAGRELLTNLFTEKKDSGEITTEENVEYKTETQISDSTEENETEDFEDEENYVILDSPNKGKVNLFDKTDILHDWKMLSYWDNYTDNYGQIHENCTLISSIGFCDSETEFENKNSSVIYLDKSYQKIQLNNIFLVEYEKSKESPTSIKFYDYDINTGDRRLIAETTGFKALTPPESFEVDVSGVEYLQICVSGAGSTLGIDSAYLE